MNKKRFSHLLKALLFILLFIIEYYIITSENNEQLIMINCILLAINLCMLTLLIILKKADHFSAAIFKIFKNIAGNILGIIAIIYFTTHIGWIFTALRDSYTTDKEHLLSQFALYLNFLFFPYLFLTFFLKKRKEEVSPKNRKVLITSLSIFDYNRNAEGELSPQEKKVLNIIKDNKSYLTWGRDVNWQPVFLAVEKYKNLEEIIVLNTKQTKYQNNAIKNSNDFKDYTFEKLIKKYFPKIKVTNDMIEKPNELQSTVEDLNFILRKKLKKYEDKDIVFSITGGTAVISAAMSMIAIKGDRGITYMDQQSNVIINNSVDVFDIKELWEEIIDKYE